MNGSGFAVVDVETSGFSPNKARVVAIAIALADLTGAVTATWSSRVNPQGSVGPVHVHGIRQDEAESAPLFAELIPEIISLLRGRALVAHNARFDVSFLRTELARAGWAYPEPPALCTLEASAYYLPSIPRRRLPDCCDAIGISMDSHHSALSDAEATAALLAYFLDPNVQPEPLPEHVMLPELALGTSWPTEPSGVAYVPPDSPPTPRKRRGPVFTGDLLSLVESSDMGGLYTSVGKSGQAAYIECLLSALADGELTADEADSISEIADAFGLSDDDRLQVHVELLLWLATVAYNDFRIDQDERHEMNTVAQLLGLPLEIVSAVIARAKEGALAEAEENLSELPADWTLGEPLRIGDQVCFTGPRFDMSLVPLEEISRSRGLRVGSSVSKKTVALVTDGTFHGTKAAAAEKLGTRIVTPSDFKKMLEHIQPALSPDESPTTRKRETNSPRATASPEHAPNPAAVRAWARENGIEIGARGRIHSSVIRAYQESQQNG